jgi:hypothetical protein
MRTFRFVMTTVLVARVRLKPNAADPAPDSISNAGWNDTVVPGSRHDPRWPKPARYAQVTGTLSTSRTGNSTSGPEPSCAGANQVARKIRGGGKAAVAVQLGAFRGERKTTRESAGFPQGRSCGAHVQIAQRQVEQDILNDIANVNRWTDERDPGHALPVSVVLESAPRQHENNDDQHPAEKKRAYAPARRRDPPVLPVAQRAVGGAASPPDDPANT